MTNKRERTSLKFKPRFPHKLRQRKLAQQEQEQRKKLARDWGVR